MDTNELIHQQIDSIGVVTVPAGLVVVVLVIMLLVIFSGMKTAREPEHLEQVNKAAGGCGMVVDLLLIGGVILAALAIFGGLTLGGGG